MHTHRLHISTIAILAMMAGGAAQAGFDEDVEKALNLGGGKYGKVNFGARYRYEYVDQDSVPAIDNQAHASTLRMLLGYLSPEWQGFKAFAEYEGNQDIGINDYNSTRNGKISYPIVADPQANEVNQLWVNYAGLPDSNVKLGRQRITFDNHRFVGNVVWRQLEQTFDAATITNTSLPDTSVVAGYIWKVQDITSRSIGMNSPIFNIAYTGLPYGKVVVHGEFLDYDNASESRLFLNSTKTVGVRFDGSMPIVDKLKALYTAEYAHQEDYKNNPLHYQVDYWLADGGLDVYGVTFRAAYEELGSDKGVGFAMPLATLHAFQGWADRFLVTPANGMRDMYGTIKTTAFGVDWIAMYHDFSDDTGRIDYGHEVDLMAEKKFGKHYSVLLKYADYVGDNNPANTAWANDRQIIWVQGSVSF